MVAKSKITIDVDASKFSDLQKAFDRYKSELEKTPDAWKAVAEAQDAVREGFAQAALDAEQMASHTIEVLDNSRKLDRVTESTSRHWKELSRNTAAVAGNIANATASLLKWAGITSVIGGLVGGGSLFAMDRLADSVASQRTQSMGLGTTYGGLSAFRTQFRRLGDPEGFLGRVSNALADPNQRGIFQQLGVSTEGDTTDVATRAILKLKDTVDRIPKNQLAIGLETRRLDKLINVEFAKTLQGMSREEVAGLAGGVRPLRKRLDLTPVDQLKWQELSTQIERATHVIGNAFTSRLVALADPLTHLSTSFVKLLDVLLKQGGPVEHWIGEFAHGLDWLATHVDSPEVKKEVSHWKDEIVHISQSAWSLGKSIATLADNFASLLGVSPAQASTGGQQGASGGYSGRSGQGHGRAALGHGSPGETHHWIGGGSDVDLGGSGGFNTRGVKNRNPGNIGYGPWAQAHGAIGSAGTDTGHGVAVFPSFESGAAALEDLALSKYGAGKHSANQLIAGPGGWTPGNYAAAANVARSMGLRPDEDLRLNDEKQRKRFRDSLMKQELGPAGARYVKDHLDGGSMPAVIAGSSSHTFLRRPHKTRITINNNPGGNVNTTSAIAAAH
jgi:hypothetical protein